MKARWNSRAQRLLAIAGAGLLALLPASCTQELILNQTTDLQGNISILIVNNTQYRAIFSFGTWNSLDRSPGPATMEQRRVERFSSVGPVDVTCRRNAAIGTDEFIQRVIRVNGDRGANFDAEAFQTTVGFSAAPSGSDAEGLATAGTARGREVLLGVDYSCGDTLIFTFEEDAAAPGGFRIDFTLLLDDPGN